MVYIRKIIHHLLLVQNIHAIQTTISPFLIQSNIHIITDKTAIQRHNITVKNSIPLFRHKQRIYLCSPRPLILHLIIIQMSISPQTNLCCIIHQKILIGKRMVTNQNSCPGILPQNNQITLKSHQTGICPQQVNHLQRTLQHHSVRHIHKHPILSKSSIQRH